MPKKVEPRTNIPVTERRQLDRLLKKKAAQETKHPPQPPKIDQARVAANANAEFNRIWGKSNEHRLLGPLANLMSVASADKVALQLRSVPPPEAAPPVVNSNTVAAASALSQSGPSARRFPMPERATFGPSRETVKDNAMREQAQMDIDVKRREAIAKANIAKLVNAFGK